MEKGVNFSPLEPLGYLIILVVWQSLYQVEGIMRIDLYIFYFLGCLLLPAYVMGFFLNMWAGVPDRRSDEPPLTKARARKGILALAVFISVFLAFQSGAISYS